MTYQMIELEERVTFITGNYGSGKTEVSVNLVRSYACNNLPITLGDLDVVNPYFRCREAAEDLESLGVRVIIPRDNYFHADLPIVKPELKGALLDGSTTFVGDVGGDDVGARILGSFAEALSGQEYALYIVLNANRPFTDTAGGSRKVIAEIEAASRLTVTGLVSNTHLMEETDLDTVMRGHDLAVEVARATGIPVKFITAPASLTGAFGEGVFDVPVLGITRTMLPPWKRREKLGSENFSLKGECG
jgi:hypothetical protein